MKYIEGKYKSLLLEPFEAGKDDPPMQDWLQLTPSENGCPHCGGHDWGTKNPVGYFAVRVCHTYGCGKEFREVVGGHTILKINEGLMNKPVRLARG